ncbi:MAG: hypothetical protein ACMUIP_12290 [bacterium]
MDKQHFYDIINHREELFSKSGKIIHNTRINFKDIKNILYFPDIRCPFCRGNILTKPREGLIELRTKIHKKWTRSFFSFFMCDSFFAVRDRDIQIKNREKLEKVTCPLCNESLFIDMNCHCCDAPIIAVNVNLFADMSILCKYEFCSREGCLWSKLEFQGLYKDQLVISRRI